jgi:catechol 2,3-dioxygenase-like lactoylglutathione lyase family enzyme
MISSIGNVALWVSDLERAEHLYVDCLGLDVIARINTPDVREVIVGRAGTGSQLMLAARPNAAGSPASVETPIFMLPREGEIATGHWKSFLWSDDIWTDVKHAVAAGATVVQEPTRLEQFGLTIAVVADHDGHLLELGQRQSPERPH